MAQTGAGTLKGKVTDASNGEPLPFANVVVLAGETQVGGGATDFDGNFTIKPIPPGSYNVKCVFVGYNPRVISGVIIKGDKITFQDFALSAGVNLDEVIVVEYVEPLIDKDGGASGGTVSRADIDKMSARTATAVASTIGGVSGAGQTGNNEGNISLRGARSDNTYYYIDGIKVRGATNLPKSAIEEVSVITGGVPANYGDATGGIISITTRGASSEFFGGVDILSSGFRSGDEIVGLDGFGQTQLEAYLSGPILFKKDENGEKTDPLLGFFLSTNVRKFEDRRPSAIGHWYLTEEAQTELENNPVFFTQNSDGSFSQQLAADYLTLDDFENVTAAKNADEFAASLQAKFDLNINKNSVFTIGGSADFRDRNDFRNYGYTATNSIANIGAQSRLNSVLNWKNNATTEQLTWRGFARYTQRFNSSEESKVKNAYYTIALDYSKVLITTKDRNHEDNFFNYGHVGTFDVERGLTFAQNQETGEIEQNGIATYYTGYTPGTANPILAGVNVGAFATTEISGDTLDADNINIIGVGNGNILNRPYGFFANVGTPANFYRDRNNSQFRLTTSGTADIGDHAITLGIEYEQRVDRGFDMAPVGLWERARQLTNDHISPIDTTVLYSGYYAEVGDFVNVFQPQVDVGQQTAFDRALRIALGLDPEGDDFPMGDQNDPATLASYLDWIDNNFIDVESLDPALLNLDMFSAGDLLRDGANLVSYWGYDHTGDILTSDPSLEDYFTAVDENGFRTYAVDAFRPVYIAGYIMDKFAFDDIIFNVGVRVDRFDANQKVLKDEYIVRDFYTVGNNPQFDEHPASIGDDYVVYVDDPISPTQVRGYRTGDDWFNSDGTSIVDPEQLQIGVSSYPYLTTTENELTAGAFKDYEPQVNVMPRVAFSFPISDEAVFFAHYDILTQRPERGIRIQLQNYEFIQTQNNVINNPALRPTTTIDYELGFQQVLSRSSALKISAFYRDMRDMIQVRELPGAFPEDYITYRNIDFGTVKGLTLTYDLRRTGNTRINANYTLQFAGGTGSNSTSGLNLAASGQPNLQNIAPLAYDQRHAINVTFDYRYGEGKDYNGPVWFGKQFFANTGMNLIANLGSGTPYSNTKRAVSVLDGRTSGGLAGTLNGARLPSIFTLNAQFDKNITLKFGKNDEGEKAKTANLNIYLLINNLLNTQNVVRVYPFTGDPDDDGFLVTPEGQQAVAGAPSPEAYAD
ncbi:MAG: TonB-dependent receptor plug domain-containing protein, partial [Flavobacteriales bacterium]|nr:TonB-dependent receptor plug domain-containing protein [Flavobacteriales bacterium]